MSRYLERQYQILDTCAEKHGLSSLGPMSSFTWNSDPKRLLFVLARYKFASRMLEGCDRVIEVGCGDGFAARIVRQHVNDLTLVDADPVMVEAARLTQCSSFPVDFIVHDFCVGPLHAEFGMFDGAYLLDVLEHIQPADELSFLTNLRSTLMAHAKIVIGMPSTESQRYASPGSVAGHVNCKTKEQLSADLGKVFSSVCVFSMNDEVVHTGYARMANYIFAVCTR